MNINDSIQNIKRKYKYVSKDQFFYNDEKDLKLINEKIIAYYLLHDIKEGYWVYNFIWRSKKQSLNEWTDFIFDTTEKGAVYILQNVILDQHRNPKHGQSWKFKSFIGWSWIGKNRDYRKIEKKFRDKK